MPRSRGASAGRHAGQRALRSAVIVAIAASAPLCAQAQQPDAKSSIPLVQRLFDAVRPRINGDSAKATVAFVEQRWRLPGNKGFDESIDHVIASLRRAGYVEESAAAAENRLTYRIETHPLRGPTWEPDSASLTVAGETVPLLRFETNRNMLAINSFSTPPGGVEAEVVTWRSLNDTLGAPADLSGRVVFGEMPIARLFQAAVQRRHAAGVISYSLPPYTHPEKHRHSIQFTSVPLDTTRKAFGLLLSADARDRLVAALKGGATRVRIMTAARSWTSVERTLIAEVRGSKVPNERFVLSAHVQEPGANDNASGVGALADMARVFAQLVRERRVDPARTITMLWGNEIQAPQRYLEENSARAADVRWGMSLDMVGENTAVTGGTFLIEKMPDPSAVWTRGEDHHTEWGGSPIPLSDVRPHYYNDFVLNRCREQGRFAGWTVSANPYEGGSDHVPFLRAQKPGLLMWHFTDEFYHTDQDRLDKVSSSELANVATCAAVSALTLVSADGGTARAIVRDVEASAMERLSRELALSQAAVAAGGKVADERAILSAWGSYYTGALRAAAEIEVGGMSDLTKGEIEAAVARTEQAVRERLSVLGGPG
ncbi:MAG: M28 family peptidase [Gemmatimonadaceae bacterium]